MEIIMGAIAVAGILGSFLVGKRNGKAREIATALGTVNLLQARVDQLEQSLAERDACVADLQQKVEMLESLATRRADVDSVREVVERIAARVGA